MPQIQITKMVPYTATLNITNNTPHDLTCTGVDWLISSKTIPHSDDRHDVSAHSSGIAAKFTKEGGVDGLFTLSGWKLGGQAYFSVYVSMSSAALAGVDVSVSTYEGQNEDLDKAEGRAVTEYYKSGMAAMVQSGVDMVTTMVSGVVNRVSSTVGGTAGTTTTTTSTEPDVEAAHSGPTCTVDGQVYRITIDKQKMEYPDSEFRITIG